ncbi:hypothetical protein Tco_0695228, partial [Tanacetum coccineum]
MHKLIEASKLFVGFDEHKCYIQDINLVKTVGTGNEFSGLYLFAEDKYLKSKFGLSNSLFVCHVSKQLCCSRLGHPSDQVLSIQSKNSHLIYNKHVSPYDICLKAKQTKDPFPLSDHKFGGDLVYLDLWGPYKVSESMENQLLSQNESELNLLNFFDNIDSILLKSPNNDKRDPSNGDGNVRASSDIDSPHPVIDEVTFATQIDEYNNISEGMRKSSRARNIPSKFNDFVLPSSKKYDIEKHVAYFKLSSMNFCFATNLNKSVEPMTYLEDTQDKHWVKAINSEMEALFRNNTWVLLIYLLTERLLGV